MANDSIVKLNVGGVIYLTSETTLKSKSERLNYFDALLSGKFSPTMIDGAYFIDRDGSIFQYILNYLRSGHYCFKISEIPLEISLYQLQEEANFYLIEDLITLIERRFNSTPISVLNPSRSHVTLHYHYGKSSYKSIRWISDQPPKPFVTDKEMIHRLDDTPYWEIWDPSLSVKHSSDYLITQMAILEHRLISEGFQIVGQSSTKYDIITHFRRESR